MLTLYEVIDDENSEKLYLITDYIENGNLKDMIHKKELAVGDIRKYFRGLISAIEYCHDFAKVMHRDIKPENILIDDKNNIKLADFGVSQLFENGDDTLSNKAGTKFYFSPELCNEKVYKGKPVDVWACGVTLYYMVLKKFPFCPISQNI